MTGTVSTIPIRREAPLIISVSGHTAIANREEAMESFSKLLDDLDSRYPNTPKILMTGMAPGADVQSAEIALSKGLVVIPVLPFELDEYIAKNPDICDGDYQEIVQNILSNPNTADPLIPFERKEDVHESYRLVSAFLVSSAHILVSFWNGAKDDVVGGTYETIKMAYSGMSTSLKSTLMDCGRSHSDSFDIINSLDINEDALIYWIRSERVGCENKALADNIKGGFVVPVIFDSKASPTSTVLDRIEDDIPKLYTRVFGQIEELNSNLAGMEDFSDPSKEIEDSGFLPIEDLPESLRPVRERIVSEGRGAVIAYHYNILNRMSVEKRDINLSITNVLSWLAVFTTLAYSIFMLAAGNVLFSVIYLVFLVASLGATSHYHRNRTYHKYLNYRCIAECLRVEYYRRISGLSGPIRPTTYEDVRNEVVWIGFVVRSWILEDIIREGSAYDESEEVLDMTRCCWINSQLEYHNMKFDQNSKGYKKHQTFGTFLSRMNVIMAAVVLISMTYLLADPTSFGHIDGMQTGDIIWIKELNIGYVQVARIVLMIIVALIARDNFDFSSLKGGSPTEIRAKIHIFRIADMRYQRAKTYEEKRAIVYDLGDYSFSEQFSWLFENKKKEFKR
jgi:hypothetical protein